MSKRDAQFAEILAGSYAALVGEPLVPDGLTGPEMASWLYEASFGLLAHDASPDPVFVYANLWAQRLFEYDWDEFTHLPSRLSAGAENREVRRLALDDVRRQGFTSGFAGPRVAKSGRNFRIEDVTIWNLLDGNAERVGQAALIRRWADA